MYSRRKTKEVLSVGYWDEDNDPKTMVDESWDRTERNHVIVYLDAGKTKHRWRGMSSCRFCGIRNGSTCLSDGIYKWPSGFSHYLLEHGVKPPEEFLKHVRSRLWPERRNG